MNLSAVVRVTLLPGVEATQLFFLRDDLSDRSSHVPKCCLFVMLTLSFVYTCLLCSHACICHHAVSSNSIGRKLQKQLQIHKDINAACHHAVFSKPVFLQSAPDVDLCAEGEKGQTPLPATKGAHTFKRSKAPLLVSQCNLRAKVSTEPNEAESSTAGGSLS